MQVQEVEAMDGQERKRKRESRFSETPRGVHGVQAGGNTGMISQGRGFAEQLPPHMSQERQKKLAHQDELKILYKSYVVMKRAVSMLQKSDGGSRYRLEFQEAFLAVVDAAKGLPFLLNRNVLCPQLIYSLSFPL